MKFKLLEKATHAGNDGLHVMLEAGTEIGDGTPYPIRKGIDTKRTAQIKRANAKAPDVPWFIPGPHMEPLDQEAKEAMKLCPDLLSIDQIPMQMTPTPPSGPQTATGF